MIESYKDLLVIYQNQRQINNAIKERKIVRISRGIYSDDLDVNAEEYFSKRYDKAIITGPTALYHYGIIKKKPKKYHLATNRDATRIDNPLVVQSFQDEQYFSVGAVYEKNIWIYNSERLLIELFRNRNKYENAIFKEAVSYYRNHIKEINVKRLNVYLKRFKNPKKLAKDINDIIF